MVEIRLKNSKTRRVEVLKPLIPGKPSMYLCGPTVYDRAHIGNARSAVVFDQLFRLLRHVYGAENVRFVRNFTDVDDKINARAAEEGREISDLTAETSQWYLDDTRALGVLDPTDMPRATAYIPEMVAFIEDLIVKGHAYAAEGHVLFSVKSFAEYGALSGRSVDDMIAGARVEVAPYKRDPMDFVLWKPSSPDLPGWDSPWGRGRPGWHIECSAMAQELLGKLDPEGYGRFDIHGGGSDLLFPHHENEIAQSCAAGHDFAQIWMHNEMLQVEGKKMSKSLGNFFTVRDLLDQGIPGEVIRFVLLSTHYGKPMDWTEKRVTEARGHLRAWNRFKQHSLSDPKREFSGKGVDDGVVSALADDLNTSDAIARVIQIAGEAKRTKEQDSDATIRLFESLAFLGLEDLDIDRIKRKSTIAVALFEDRLSELATNLQASRDFAQETKDFSKVDALKSELTNAGVEVRMSKDGVELLPGPDFDPAKLEGL